MNTLSPLTGLDNYPGSRVFTPLALSPALWLKADAGLYQTAGGSAATADGDPVGQWQDQSGNARHLAQATASQRGTLKLAIQNGKPVVRFDGADDFLQVATFTEQTQPNTAVLVAKSSETATTRVLMDGGTSGLRHEIFQFSSNFSVSAGTAAYTGVAVPAAFFLLSVLFNGASSEAWLNGASIWTGSLGTDLLDGCTLGSYYAGLGVFWQGDVGELLIGDFTAGGRVQLESHLRTKWGTP